MTPSGSVAGHLTDLVSGELGPGLCPGRQSGQAGHGREEREDCIPGRHDYTATRAGAGGTCQSPWDASLHSDSQPSSSLILPSSSRPPGEMDNAILGKTTKDWLSILTIGDSSWEKFPTQIGFDAVASHSVPCIESPSERKSQMSGVETLPKINNSRHEIFSNNCISLTLVK